MTRIAPFARGQLEMTLSEDDLRAATAAGSSTRPRLPA